MRRSPLGRGITGEVYYFFSFLRALRTSSNSASRAFSSSSRLTCVAKPENQGQPCPHLPLPIPLPFLLPKPNMRGIAAPWPHCPIPRPVRGPCPAGPVPSNPGIIQVWKEIEHNEYIPITFSSQHNPLFFTDGEWAQGYYEHCVITFSSFLCLCLFWGHYFFRSFWHAGAGATHGFCSC